MAVSTVVTRQARSVIRTDIVRVNVAESPKDRAKWRWLRVVGRSMVSPTDESEEELVLLTLEDGHEFTVTADCEMQVR